MEGPPPRGHFDWAIVAGHKRSIYSGDCTLHVVTPASGGPWRAVIFYMDAGGIRPAILAMAQRLAQAGYIVLLPDLFYRYGLYWPFVPKEVFAGDFRAVLGPLMATTSPLKAAEDAEAILAYLDTRDDDHPALRGWIRPRCEPHASLSQAPFSRSAIAGG